MGVSTVISDVDSVHKIEYLASDLNTSSVTLFPSRAQVYREIKGVQLKRGTNEVTVVGLSQTIDPDSIKVESNGVATITNLEVEEVPNRQLFHEVYPESDSESDSESESEESSDDQVRAESSHLTSARDVLHQLRDKLAIAHDTAGNAQRRLQLLEGLHTLDNRKNDNFIQLTLEQYKDERTKAFHDLTEANKLARDLNEQVEKAEKKVSKLQREEDKKTAKEDKAKARARKEKEKKKALKERLRNEARREKERLREEQEEFWPLDVLSVRITLEVATFTPMTSRRGSTSSDVDVTKIPAAEIEGEDTGPIECNLAFSYVTSSAYWKPSYDLQLSTTNASASLYFDAMLTNQTSESWKNCKVTLSTSQATFSGLDDKIPTLVPWRIKIGPKYPAHFQHRHDITRSNEEMASMTTNLAKAQTNQDSSFNMRRVKRKSTARRVTQQDSGIDYLQQASQQRLQQPPMAPPPPRPMATPQIRLFSAPPDAAPMAAAAPMQAPASGGLFGSAGGGGHDSSIARVMERGERLQDFDYDAFLNEPRDDGDANDSYDASLVEETGLTTTYDLPGLKTLIPKHNGSKQRVARIPFSNVVFSHTVVAKYKPVAYLKAKLKNSSKIALLKGNASLTLDGTFMGKTSLPRCSSGESFSLSLGVDPAIKVTYPKPEVHRTSSGLFNKEDSSVYVRAVTLHNTRAVGGRAVNLLVLDQVPVSEDERLRVELSHPRGLVTDSKVGVPTGVSGKGNKDDGDWGSASAKSDKEGKVSWDVSLNAGKEVKLSLEYVVSMPSGEVAQQV
ncbi:mucoidy inhibitor [Trichoderma arundinaceum]|uniref:Mucoidy inhibitor n=1 Tax=Trichoderma arundinaceum TaxID=490622 RepID=A0A395NL63_TRIAR|nr:mucoidy inhibitor [Trichoderma arundinaceum]